MKSLLIGAAMVPTLAFGFWGGPPPQQDNQQNYQNSFDWFNDLFSSNSLSNNNQRQRPSFGNTFSQNNTNGSYQNEVSITTDSNYRSITSNGIADHTTGSFPNSGNPNAISPQNYNYRVPLNPTKSESTTDARGQVFGVGLNGVPFDPGTAEFWNGNRDWSYEALSGAVKLGIDNSNAHVQPTGAYHYHGIPTGLINNLKGANDLVLIGYAADGFPMYYSQSGQYTSGYELKNGTRSGGPGGNYDGSFASDYEHSSSNGNLDVCNGTNITSTEYPGGTYAYFVTEAFPIIPRCFSGTSDSSFNRGGPGSSQGQRPGFGSGQNSRPSFGSGQNSFGPPRFGDNNQPPNLGNDDELGFDFFDDPFSQDVSTFNQPSNNFQRQGASRNFQQPRRRGGRGYGSRGSSNQLGGSSEFGQQGLPPRRGFGPPRFRR